MTAENISEGVGRYDTRGRLGLAGGSSHGRNTRKNELHHSRLCTVHTHARTRTFVILLLTARGTFATQMLRWSMQSSVDSEKIRRYLLFNILKL